MYRDKRRNITITVLPAAKAGSMFIMISMDNNQIRIFLLRNGTEARSVELKSIIIGFKNNKYLNKNYNSKSYQVRNYIQTEFPLVNSMSISGTGNNRHQILDTYLSTPIINLYYFSVNKKSFNRQLCPLTIF